MEEIIEALQDEKQRVTNAIAILRHGRRIDRKQRRMSEPLGDESQEGKSRGGRN